MLVVDLNSLKPALQEAIAYGVRQRHVVVGEVRERSGFALNVEQIIGKGTLDLNEDQTLNLLLSPDFNADVIVGSSSLKKGTTAIITQTEKFMSYGRMLRRVR